MTMAGLQLWNVEYWDTTSLGDFMGPNYEIKKLKPISIVGVRNGFHSGRVVVTSSTGPISGLKATITDLAGKDGKSKIAASQVQIRYPDLGAPDYSYCPPYRFDRLIEEAPEEVKQVDLKSYRNWKPKNEGPVAMQPIWVTVHVPSDAAPGAYAATLKIEAENEQPYTVPVELTVHAWLLPDARNYTVRNMVWLGPERVAKYYELPMWSEKHLEYCAKSLQMALLLGSRNVEANLVLHYLSRDNAEVMVKWLKQADGTYKYDLTAFDKYCDTVDKAIGKPFVFRLNMWSSQKKPFHSVQVVDAAGAVSELEQPPQGTAESLAFWKPVLDEIHARMDKRGWTDIMAANWHEYCGGPDSNTVTMLQKIWPGIKWADNDHGRRQGFAGLAPADYTPVIVQSTVWQEGPMKPRGYKGALQPGAAYCGHARDRTRDESSSLWDMRAFIEEVLLKGEHGVDPLGGDLFMNRDARGRWASGSWAACALGPGNCTKSILGPGPNGPIATERFEATRESIQICEAILFLERALQGGKLDAALAARANKVLDERSSHLIGSYQLADKSGAMKFDRARMAAGAFEAENELFATAADVATAQPKK